MATFNAHATLGALEIGVLVSTFLFGVLTVQTYVYYSTFPKDKALIKWLVAAVWVLELAHNISICNAVYIVTINEYGHPEKLIKVPKSLSAAILFSGFVGPMVQAFFAHRVWIFSQSLTIPLLCWFLSALRFLGSVVTSVEGIKMISLEQFESHWQWLITAVLAVGATVDVIIAASLCFHFNKRRNSGFKRLLDQLILWTVETGLITSLGAVVMLVSFLTMKNNFIWVALFMLLAKLFSNSLMAALNGRTKLRKLETGSDESYMRGSDSVSIHHQITPIAFEMSRAVRAGIDDAKV